MIEGKARTEVDVGYFGERVKFEKDFSPKDPDGRYTYRVSCKGTNYTLKRFQIPLEHLNPMRKRSVELLEKSIREIIEVFCEYSLAKITSLLSPHVPKPLFIDFLIEPAKDKFSSSFIYIEIIFEDAGVSLDTLKPMSIGLTYNLARQSANVLSLFHNLGIAHTDIKPESMVYDKEKDLLKLIDIHLAPPIRMHSNMQSAFENAAQNKKMKGTSVYAPPEIVREAEAVREVMRPVGTPNAELALDAASVYRWGMIIYALLSNRDYCDLERDCKAYKADTEEDYKDFMECVEGTLAFVKPKSSAEADMMDAMKEILFNALKFTPEERPRMGEIIGKMRELEKTKEIALKYSQTELKNNKDVAKLLTLEETEEINRDANSEGDIMLSTKAIEIFKKEIKDFDEKEEKLVQLCCGHRVPKCKIAEHALKSFIQKKRYEHSIYCRMCSRIERISRLPLNCGCEYVRFGGRGTFTNPFQNMKFSKKGYGQCKKSHPLNSIDSGLLSDHISFKLSVSMLSDYLKRKNNHFIIGLLNAAIINESISNIAWALKHTEAIEKLIMHTREISNSDSKAISDALRDNTTLVRLELNNNKLTNKGVKAICGIFQTNRTLEQIDLMHNNIESKSTKIISKMLKTCAKPVHLNLSANKVGDIGAKNIGEALKLNTTLVELFLSGNGITDVGAKAIGEALKVNATLKRIDLSKNSIGAKGGVAMSEVLKCNKVFAILNLNSNSIGTEGARAIGEALKENTTLTKLCIRTNSISEEGIDVIGEALKTSKSLEYLDLCENLVNVEIGVAIGDALKDNTVLKTLRVSHSKIKGECARAIIKALKTNKVLEVLDLKNNELNDEDANAISEALYTNATLSKLYLNCNLIHDEGLVAIAEAFRANSTLAYLNLSGNQYSPQTGKKLADAARSRKNLPIEF